MSRGGRVSMLTSRANMFMLGSKYLRPALPNVVNSTMSMQLPEASMTYKILCPNG